jgi:hypothetical protein
MPSGAGRGVGGCPAVAGHQWRGWHWPHSHEGNGGPVSVEDYPFQGVDLDCRSGYRWTWEALAVLSAHQARESMRAIVPGHRSGDLKHKGVTPFGTPVAVLARTGGDMLCALCGRCGTRLGECRCDMEVSSESQAGGGV